MLLRRVGYRPAMTDSSNQPSTDPSYGHDQDAEPPLTAPGLDGPTGVDEPATDGAAEGGNPDADDQDAEPSKNALES
ncbi:hypothetical protein GCM10012276_00380 [Nocardioides deserti]|nr:hypothetical protein GCM10012276_00380 [Nocardioides deserti]